MIFIIKKKLNGEFLGYEITDFIDNSKFAKDKLYEDRMILEITETEIDNFECIVYVVTLSDDLFIN